MVRPLESLECAVIGNGPKLIYNILLQREGPDAVQLVRKVIGIARQVNGGLDFIVNSTPWARFAALYPEEVGGILCDVENGSIDSE